MNLDTHYSGLIIRLIRINEGMRMRRVIERMRMGRMRVKRMIEIMMKMRWMNETIRMNERIRMKN